MEYIRGYRVVVEQADGNWSAYSPDLLGCVSTGPTYEQTLLNMREAIDGHIAVMEEYGMEVPPPYAEPSQYQTLAHHQEGRS